MNTVMEPISNAHERSYVDALMPAGAASRAGKRWPGWRGGRRRQSGRRSPPPEPLLLAGSEAAKVMRAPGPPLRHRLAADERWEPAGPRGFPDAGAWCDQLGPFRLRDQ
jgi:hypothetical protein